MIVKIPLALFLIVFWLEREESQAKEVWGSVSCEEVKAVFQMTGNEEMKIQGQIY